jgi:hypothetical protein
MKGHHITDDGAIYVIADNPLVYDDINPEDYYYSVELDNLVETISGHKLSYTGKYTTTTGVFILAPHERYKDSKNPEIKIEYSNLRKVELFINAP